MTPAVPSGPGATPWYVRTTYILAGMALLLGLLYVAKDLLVPLVYAGLLAVLLHPLNSALQRRGVPRVLAILVALAFACIAVGAVVALLGMEVGQFADELPRLRTQGEEFVGRIQAFIRSTLGITYKDQLRWFQQWWSQTWQRGGETVAQAFLTFMNITSLIILVPLYAFLMLYYKDHLIEFLYQFCEEDDRETLRDILFAARSVVKGYVVGLIIETSIVAVLNSVALLLLGIDYAILWGIIAAILNLIPYIGGIVGTLLPVLMALITKDSAWYPVGVVLAFIAVQIIDDHLLVPTIVASRISINALISVVAVITGGMIWGISGMFLSLPVVAIVKIICDRVERLKPFGMLLGQETRDVAVEASVKRT